jgi:leucyl/phenylalanyl-tRNA--protein transferase
MIEAYERLHLAGYAHSLEVWCEGHLAGGIYGVAIGGFFAGESMFHRRRDASKLAMVRLADHLRERQFALLDIQFLTPHTARMGGIEISRDEYLERLKSALERDAALI